MPYPNPKVATTFLNDYIYVRQHKWNTLWGWLSTFVSDGPEAKIGECKLLNRDFYNAEGTELADNLKTAEGWFKLFLKLGKSGRTHSFLSATTHAIRAYYIKNVIESELGEDFGKLVQTLREETASLEETIRKMDDTIITMMESQSTRDDVEEAKRKLEEEKKKLNENLLKLSDLGDIRSTCKAARAGLFGELLCPSLKDLTLPQKLTNTIYENIPLFYHPNYDVIHFEQYYHKLQHVGVSFKDYQSDERLGKMPNEITAGSDLHRESGIPTQPGTTGLMNGLSTMFSAIGSLVGSGGKSTGVPINPPDNINKMH